MANAYEPDDWDSYYRHCPMCGQKYHMSGAEPCACEPCSRCEKLWPPDEMYNDDLCLQCAHCESCGQLSAETQYIESADLNLCSKCTWKENEQ